MYEEAVGKINSRDNILATGKNDVDYVVTDIVFSFEGFISMLEGRAFNQYCLPRFQRDSGKRTLFIESYVL